MWTRLQQSIWTQALLVTERALTDVSYPCQCAKMRSTSVIPFVYILPQEGDGSVATLQAAKSVQEVCANCMLQQA